MMRNCGRDRRVTRIMCINCNIILCVNRMRRYRALELDIRVTTLLCSWVYPQIGDDYICEACRDLAMSSVNHHLQETSGIDDQQPGPSNQGHAGVCLLCGCSIMERQSDRILRDNTNDLHQLMYTLIENRIATRQITKDDYNICEACRDLANASVNHRLQETSGIDDQQPGPNHQGHAGVCLLCGCSIFQRQSDRILRDNTNDLHHLMYTLIENRIAPRQITKDICEACRDLANSSVNHRLQETSGIDDQQPGPSHQGHAGVCLLCGCSIMERQSDRILRDNTNDLHQLMYTLIENRIATRQITKDDYNICEACRDLANASVNHRLQETSGIDDQQPGPNHQGHAGVCLLCGCSIFQRQSDRILRDNTNDLHHLMYTLIENRIAPRQITKDICEACRDLANSSVNHRLQETSGIDDQQPGPSHQGHAGVCLLCGCSIMERQSDRILRDNTNDLHQLMYTLIENRIATRQITKDDYNICEACRDLVMSSVNHRLQETSGIDDQQPGPSNQGHAGVCLLCRCSIFQRQSDRKLRDSTNDLHQLMYTLIENRIAPRQSSELVLSWYMSHLIHLNVKKNRKDKKKYCVPKIHNILDSSPARYSQKSLLDLNLSSQIEKFLGGPQVHAVSNDSSDDGSEAHNSSGVWTSHSGSIDDDLGQVLNSIENQLGSSEIKNGNYDNGLSLLRSAASRNHAPAIYNLALCYEMGRGVPVDEKIAMGLYRTAASMHHAGALFNLGVYYGQGRGGLPRDHVTARRLLKLAAVQGHEEAVKAIKLLDPDTENKSPDSAVDSIINDKKDAPTVSSLFVQNLQLQNFNGNKYNDHQKML